jgi:subtilisin
MTRRALTVATTVLVIACSDAPEPVGVTDAELHQAGFGSNEFIVLLDPGRAPGTPGLNRARAAEVAGELGVSPRHTYGTAVFGFSGAVPQGRLHALRRDPRVVLVEPVEELELAEVVSATGPGLPTGVDRIELDRNASLGLGSSPGLEVDLDIAIIDSGIAADHPDLNVAGGRNFVGGNPDGWSDANGHGTHVSGTVAARDNGSPVVGVAPGARLWAVRVCRPSGSCPSDAIVAAIDWVAERKAAFKEGAPDGIDFAAANYSVSGGFSPFECGESGGNAIFEAICGVAEQGVVFVRAAMNQGNPWTSNHGPYSPAQHPVKITVSALADFDGKAGGAGPPTCRDDEDDTLADFSNYGEIDITAPGVCIRSTEPGGGYGMRSGTSMSTPHVTGAVALYLHANEKAPASDRAGVGAIKAAIVGAALPKGTTNHECSYDGERSGGPLLFVNAPEFGGDGTCEVAGEPPQAPETGTIEGTVTATDTGAGVEGANIVVVGSDLSGATDEDGHYTIKDVPEGQYTVTASAAGFESRSHTVTVTGGQTIRVDFELDPETGGPGGAGPVIEDFAVSTRSSGPWRRADVAWTVSHEDGALALVRTELLDDQGNTLDSRSSDVSGSLASGEHDLRTRNHDGDLVVRLTVRDTAGNEVSMGSPEF